MNSAGARHNDDATGHAREGCLEEDLSEIGEEFVSSEN